MQNQSPFITTFAIDNGMYSVDILVKQLNSLVKIGLIHSWRTGEWKNWERADLNIEFDTAEDAEVAKEQIEELLI